MRARDRKRATRVGGLMGVVALAWLVAACGDGPCRDAAGGCRPRKGAILILVDTLRADHLGLYGYPQPTTPHLDRRAREAVVFERAFATSPWTLPTVGSLLTGLMPSQHGGGERYGPGRWKRAPMNADAPMLAERLGERGFETGAFVSNPYMRPFFGVARGFDTYEYERDLAADEEVDRAIAWLDQAPADAPFFLLIHLMDPHLPYHERYAQTWEQAPEGSAPWPPGFVRKDVYARIDSMKEADRRFLVSLYDAEIAFLDRELERFFRALEERGLWGSSFIVLTADHGEEFFDHGGFEHGHTVSQELLHVPLLAWGPGVVPRREPTPVSLADVAPTLFEAVTGETWLAGSSLLETLRAGQPPARRPLVSENLLYGRDLVSVIDWPHKLVFVAGGERTRLYDLDADPGEQHDLASERPEVVARLLASVERRGTDEGRGSDPRDRAIELDEQTREELESIGYVD